LAKYQPLLFSQVELGVRSMTMVLGESLSSAVLRQCPAVLAPLTFSQPGNNSTPSGGLPPSSTTLNGCAFLLYLNPSCSPLHLNRFVCLALNNLIIKLRFLGS
jgi:hypothetical protein